MKHFFYLTLFFTTIFSNPFKIVDDRNEPIENAQIFNDINGFVTDKDGLFFIDDNNCIDYRVSHIGFQGSFFNPCISKSTIILTNLSIPGPEVKVSASLNKTKLKDNLANVEIFTSPSIVRSDKVNLEDILTTSTNVNFSGTGSRPRYFQIRGIGEYEQYASQGGPSYYVATYIDNFNYSGLGMPASLFDVDQVEVVKGSQSYCFGQNALGGIIKINSKRPKPIKEIKFETKIGSFDKKSINLVFNHPLNDSINLRYRVSKHLDRGFIYNSFINDYSNKRDEFISKIQLSYSKILYNGNSLYLLFSSLFSNLNNNYDRWSYSNFNDMKNLTTHSNFELLPNNESKDALNGKSNSIEAIFQTKNNFKSTAIVSSNNIYLDHYYDADWSNPYQWPDDHYGDHYDFAQQEERNRKDISIDLKISKPIGCNEVTLGSFSKALEEVDHAMGFVFWTNGGWVSNFKSKYSINYKSHYFQIKSNFSKTSYFILNLRKDIYRNIYTNFLETSNSITYEVDGSNSENIPLSEGFFSYRFGLKYKNFHLSYSNGHKPGGFNQNPFIESNSRQYNPESSNSIEFGYKVNNKSLFIDLNLFYMHRTDLQVDIADQADPANPVTFYFYTANINRGYNTGIDLSSNFRINDKLNTFFNCGLLETQRDGFSYPSPVINPNPVVPSREQARAPRYTISSGIEFNPTRKFFTRFEILAKDSYYYFNNSNQKSSSYVIGNISAMYQFSNHLNINLSIKNVADRRYSIHAFYFSVSGYEDRKFHESPANPRDFSLSLTYSL